MYAILSLLIHSPVFCSGCNHCYKNDNMIVGELNSNSAVHMYASSPQRKLIPTACFCFFFYYFHCGLEYAL